MEMCDWEKPPNASSLRELEQLRVLTMYEFDLPLCSQELLRALHACGNRTDNAYAYLTASRRQPHSITIPGSAPAATVDSSMEHLKEETRSGT